MTSEAHGAASAREFMAVGILTIVCGALAIAGVSFYLNPYGLFGDVTGDSYTAYRGERTTKYLLSYNYVPSNFDGLLIGASISLNWNTKRIEHPKIYNAAISGANMFEEGLIANEVMKRTRLKWLVIALQPYLTMTHGRRTEYMTPSEYWSAFGSLSLFFLESSKMLVEHGLATDRHNDYGDSDYSEGASPASVSDAMSKYIADRKRTGKPSSNFGVAAGALDDVRAVISLAKGAGTRILVVSPPVYRLRYEAELSDWDAYWARIRPLFPADTAYLDFNTPAFDKMRSDLNNFQDAVHLSRRCSDTVVDEIGRFINAENANDH